MCEATTIAIVAATVVSAGASVVSAQNQRETAKFNKRVAQFQAEDAIARGKQDELAFRRETAQFIGLQKARFAANGVLLGDGSASDVLADSNQFGELDALRIRANAEREAFGFNVQAKNFRAQRREATIAGTANVASSVLGGASAFANTKN